MPDRDFAKEIGAATDEVRDLLDEIEGAAPGSEDQGCAADQLTGTVSGLAHLVDEAYVAREAAVEASS